jgi:hypothetical protein
MAQPTALSSIGINLAAPDGDTNKESTCVNHLTSRSAGH